MFAALVSRGRSVTMYYAFTLYDLRGKEVFDLGSACEAAEDIYGDDWTEVYNGIEGMNRDDYTATWTVADAGAVGVCPGA